MSEQKLEQKVEVNGDDGLRFLKKAIIAFAIIEALVLIPVILHKIFS